MKTSLGIAAAGPHVVALHRSHAGSAAIAELARRVAGAASGAAAAWRVRRLAQATARHLAALDPHLLRDIGLDRSEITSAAAELAGLIARQRLHALRSRRP